MGDMEVWTSFPLKTEATKARDFPGLFCFITMAWGGGLRPHNASRAAAQNAHPFFAAAITSVPAQATANYPFFFRAENRVPVIPISLRNGFLPLAPAVRYGFSTLAALRIGCVCCRTLAGLGLSCVCCRSLAGLGLGCVCCRTLLSVEGT